MTIGTEMQTVPFQRSGVLVGNVRHYNGVRERFHWMGPRACDLCDAYERIGRAQEEYALVETRYWEAPDA